MRILRCLTNQRFKLLYEKEQRKSAFREKIFPNKINSENIPKLIEMMEETQRIVLNILVSFVI